MKIRTLKELAPVATASIKHSPTSSQIVINPHTEGPGASVFLICIHPVFNKKVSGMLKSRKNSLKKQTSIRTKLRYDINMDLLKREFNNYISMLRIIMEKADNI